MTAAEITLYRRENWLIDQAQLPSDCQAKGEKFDGRRRAVRGTVSFREIVAKSSPREIDRVAR